MKRPIRIHGWQRRPANRGAGRRFAVLLAILLMLAASASRSGARAAKENGLVPLPDLGSGTYLGFEGGLYPGGSNQMPAEHRLEGLQRAQRIEPLDRNGQPDRDGKIVLLSIGMSNTDREFCGGQDSGVCHPWSFMGQAAADPAVDKTRLAVVNGARGGETAPDWVAPTHRNYAHVKEEVLERQELSETQVQVIWLKQARATPRVSLPERRADAFRLVESLAEIVRTLKIRYPNLQLVFVSSRIYAGYAVTELNPEPFAYETGFAVKWLIEAQIRQMKTGEVNRRAGDLDYRTVAPWIAWGPYLWADGQIPRRDGLVWLPEDLASDGTHPSDQGVRKVGQLLMEFFKTSPFTSCWFLADQRCAQPEPVLSASRAGKICAGWFGKFFYRRARTCPP